MEAYWSRFLGVPVSALQNPGIVITPHAELRDYRGIWFFVRGRSAVVSAPSEWVARFEQKLASAVAQDLLSPDAVGQMVGNAAGKVLGPSFQGWLPANDIRTTTSHGVRRLLDSEAELVRRFQSSCSIEEWEHGGIEPSAGDIWASFHESEIVALGQLRLHTHGAVDPCIITDPGHRSEGHASRVVAAMAQEALSAERLVLYQTLLANGPACSVARRLGFAQYATLVAVRLRPDAG